MVKFNIAARDVDHFTFSYYFRHLFPYKTTFDLTKYTDQASSTIEHPTHVFKPNTTYIE
jgi:hypothetical protein